MTLYNLFHPLVVHIVTCRHEAMQGKPCTQDVLYGYIVREYARIRKIGQADASLAKGIEDACTYTAFYVDFMVHESPFPFAATWRDLGRSQYNELAGDEKFFDYMRRWLEEDTPLALDHLRLMHAMIASGFSGALERRSVRLESLMRQCSDKLAIAPEMTSQNILFLQTRDDKATVKTRKPARLGRAILILSITGFLGGIWYYVNGYTLATQPLREVIDNTRHTISNDTLIEARNTDTLVVSPIKLAPHDEGASGGSDTPADDAHPSETPAN